MKKVSLILVAFVLTSYVIFVIGYYITTPDKKIARRAFTLGGWSACESGPSLWDRHMANISYAYFYLPGSVNRYQESGIGLILTALNVAKCNPEDPWIFFDTSRVKRGIELGLKNGESINEVGGAGVAAIHIAVAAQRLDILKFVIEKGADIDLKSSDDSLFLPNATPLEMAKNFKLTLELDMDKVIQFLKEQELNKSSQQDASKAGASV